MILCNHPKDDYVLWIWSKVVLSLKIFSAPSEFSGSAPAGVSRLWESTDYLSPNFGLYSEQNKCLSKDSCLTKVSLLFLFL